MAKVIPVIQEEAQVTKKPVVRGRVRVEKKVHEREEVIDQKTYQEVVDIERVPINQVVNVQPQVRQEGDTTIIPVVEEVLVTEKRLVLKEEVRVTRRRQEIHQPATVNLRSEEVNVERLNPDETTQEERANEKLPAQGKTVSVQEKQVSAKSKRS